MVKQNLIPHDKPIAYSKRNHPLRLAQENRARLDMSSRCSVSFGIGVLFSAAAGPTPRSQSSSAPKPASPPPSGGRGDRGTQRQFPLAFMRRTHSRKNGLTNLYSPPMLYIRSAADRALRALFTLALLATSAMRRNIRHRRCIRT